MGDSGQGRELKVIQDFYDFTLCLLGHVEKFPRQHRYSLGMSGGQIFELGRMGSISLRDERPVHLFWDSLFLKDVFTMH